MPTEAKLNGVKEIYAGSRILATQANIFGATRVVPHPKYKYEFTMNISKLLNLSILATAAMLALLLLASVAKGNEGDQPFSPLEDGWHELIGSTTCSSANGGATCSCVISTGGKCSINVSNHAVVGCQDDRFAQCGTQGSNPPY